MVAQFPGRGHPQSEVAAGGSRRIVLRIVAGVAEALAICVAVALWLLPVLGRRGDLNSIVEDAIQSVFSVQVQIENIETDALSEFSITRIKSLSAEKGAAFRFRSDRLTLFYSPLELILGRRMRELNLESPSLVLDLDRDLAGVFRLPPRPAGGGAGFTIDRFRISDGRMMVRLGGRDLPMEGLELDATGLGSGGDLSYRVEASLWGSRFSSHGDLIRIPGPPDRPASYRIEAAGIEIDSLDLAPLVEFLRPGTLAGGGLFSLTGTAQGVWPEKVEVRLSSRLEEGLAGDQGALRLLGGAGRLDIGATVHGELERVDFDVDLGGEGRIEEGREAEHEPSSFREELSFRARGTYEKGTSPGGGGQVRLDEINVLVPDLGEVDAGGSLDLSAEEPVLSLDVHLAPLPIERLVQHAVSAPLREVLRGLEGRLELRSHVSGTLARPEASLEFTLEQGGLLIGGRRVGAELSGRAARAAFLAQDRKVVLEGAVVTLEEADLDEIALAAGLAPDRGSLRGKLRAEGRSEKLELPGGPLSGQVEFTLGDGRIALTGAKLEAPSFTAHGQAWIAGDPASELQVRFETTLRAEEVALGPVVESLDREPLQVSGEAAVGAGSGGVRLDLEIQAPSTGPVAFSGTVSSPSGEAVLDFDVRAGAISNDRFLGTWLRDPFKEKVSLLEGARFSGQSSLAARLWGPPGDLVLDGVLRSGDLGAALKGIELEGVEVGLPVRIGGKVRDVVSAAPGSLLIARLKAPGVDLPRVWLPFTLESDTYRIAAETVQVALFGGMLRLGEVELRPTAAAGERLRLALHATDFQVEQLAPLFGLPAIPGRGQLDVRKLTWSGDRLDLDGLLSLDIWEGRIELRGISIEHPTTPYRLFTLAEGTVHDLNLLRLGRTFRFGLVSGILDGWIKDVVFTTSEVIRFEIELETVPWGDVPQYIDKSAIESIQRVLTGPFGALEQAFFTRFRYAGFGFRASLDRGRFRLRGKYHFGDTEHILYSRWYQIPRVNIINTHPDIDYDWTSIFENLKQIYRSPSQKAANGEEP